MSRMIDLDDAAEVAFKIIRVYTGATVEESDVEYVRSELEQKCYINHCGDEAFKRLDGLIRDINPAEIVSQIEADNLRHWCKTIQVEMDMALIKLGTVRKEE